MLDPQLDAWAARSVLGRFEREGLAWSVVGVAAKFESDLLGHDLLIYFPVEAQADRTTALAWLQNVLQRIAMYCEILLRL